MSAQSRISVPEVFFYYSTANYRQALDSRNKLGKALNIEPDSRKRRHAGSNVFLWTGEFFWTLDWKIYKRPCKRPDTWLLLATAAYQACRVSDFIESNARRKSGIGLHYKVKSPMEVFCQIINIG
jgi:hypothetical protein